MKVAVTSQNFRTVTGHAGMARRFIVFDASAESGVAEVTRLDALVHHARYLARTASSR